MKNILPKILFIATLYILLKVLFLGTYPDFNAYYYGTLNNNILNYPPFVTIFFSLFSLVPIAVASKAWVILSIISLFLSLYLCFKLFNIKFQSSTALVLSSLAFIYFPVKFTLGMGQLNLFVLIFVVLTFYYYVKGKDSYSGIFLGISLMLKLFPVLLLIYFLLQRECRIFIYSLITFVGLGVISYIFIKPEINNYYWQHLLSVLSSVPVDYYNQGLSGFLARQFDNLLLRNILRIIISIFLIISSFWVIIKNKSENILEKMLGFGLVVSTNVLVNGYAWQHHFVWLVLPFLVTFFYIKGKKLGTRYFILLGVSYLLTSTNLRDFSSFPSLVQSHVFFGASLLWIINVYLLLKYD